MGPKLTEVSMTEGRLEERKECPHGSADAMHAIDREVVLVPYQRGGVEVVDCRTAVEL